MSPTELVVVDQKESPVELLRPLQRALDRPVRAALEELAGQLVLLRFARGAESVHADRRRMEEVLARIEALAALTSADMDNSATKC